MHLFTDTDSYIRNAVDVTDVTNDKCTLHVYNTHTHSKDNLDCLRLNTRVITRMIHKPPHTTDINGNYGDTIQEEFMLSHMRNKNCKT